MLRFSKLFGIVAGGADRANDKRNDPQLTGASKRAEKQLPDLTTANWQGIKEKLQTEVRGLVSKSILESIYGAPPVVSPMDPGILLQTTVNRIYADVLYEILIVEATPPFEPAETILQWAEDALDDFLEAWHGRCIDAENSEDKVSIDDRRSVAEVILVALSKAAKNEVLKEAAQKRVEAGSAVVAAE